VQRAVELAVASSIESVAVVSSRGHGDRRDAGDPGELRVALEALGAGCLPDQDRCA
jgi:hypothetical protein